LWVLWLAIKEPKRLNIWHFQFVAALLSGFMGSLDPGSSDNVYIPMGMLFILCGTMALHEGVERVQALRRYRVDLLALYLTLAFFLFNPFSVIVSSKAGASYSDFIAMLRSLDGPVYAPSLGQLAQGYELHPAAHWVALDDMIRGPGRETGNHPNTRQLLEPVIRPNGPAYILTNRPISADGLYGFFTEHYVLNEDFLDRFEPLRVLPKRWDHGWPRYLYRYVPATSPTQTPVASP
jgi:hypothetical protein